MAKKIKITWWVLREGKKPMVHAVRDGNATALCGWAKNETSHQVRGKKIDEHKHCVRCTAQLGRFETAQ